MLSVYYFFWYFFVYSRRNRKIIELVKRRREIKRIIKKWYKNYLEKERKVFNVEESVFKGDKIFRFDFVLEKISPKEVFLETQTETELGLKWIGDCINLIDRNYDLKKLLK